MKKKREKWWESRVTGLLRTREAMISLKWSMVTHLRDSRDSIVDATSTSTSYFISHTAMAPIAFSGTLPSKKKADLQEIALALGIDDTGIRDDLRARIEKHLEKHQSKYSDDPVFSGLYGKRKKSVQPALG